MALSASDLSTVFSLLSNSLNADQNLRGPAETALSQCESRPGFCSCLMEIITAKDLVSHADVRLLASVYFKNSINRYWRNRRDAVGISNEEKIHLRKKLLSHLREENYKIAQQLAILISKIARIDYPREWPELFSVLAQQLQVADILTSHRIFVVLFRTLKELSTKRLTADQRNFAEISSHLFDYCWHLWRSDVQTILNKFSSGQCFSINTVEQQDLHLTCERWLLCSKIIRQLIISGYQSDAKSVQEVLPVKEVCPAILNAVQSFVPYHLSFHEAHPKLSEFILRACVKLMKILVIIQSRHPYSFGDKTVLPPVLEFCLNKIMNPEPEIIPFEQFLIQCMVMVKSVLECKEYKSSPIGRVVNDNGLTVENMKRNISNAVADILASLLPNERVILLCNILIRRYFVFTANDLEGWYKNPEGFHHEQDMIQWTEKLRPCAEALYIVLFENHRQLLGPVVVSILHEAMEGCPALETEISPKMLLKDAAYTAAGHVYYELSSYLNFNDWFKGVLSPELSNGHPNMRIIHRKIAFILGQWVSEIKGDMRKPVYFALIRLLTDEDLAVRLAACRSLGFLVGDINFQEEDFMDLLPSCWDLCFNLVEQVQEFDSKVQVLNLISVLIEHIGEKIIPFANKLVDFFQKVWEESTGESLLQIQLLVALRNFVSALGIHSPVCYDMLLPILRMCIDVNNPDELNLLEDGVLLWESAISHAPSMVPQLLELFPYLLAVMEKSFDHLKVAIEIIEGYIILGGREFLNRHASIVAQLLDGTVGNVNDKGLLSTFPVIEILIQLFPNEVPPLISNSLQKLIVICLSGGDEHDPSKASVKASGGAILARLLVMNPNYLAHLTAQPSFSVALQQAGVSVDQNIILCIADLWLDKIDNMTAAQRKICALALSIILTLRMPQVLDKLDQILSVCTSVLLGGSEDANGDDSSNNASSMPSPESVPTKELRRRQIRASDPVRELSLEKSLKDNLQACSALHGDSSFNAVIAKLHPAAFQQLQQALKLAP
ncbi:hypothetical protein H6P81_006424 [Aristolochia fimbriata]|uniref:Importin N-terminal domain-containing protein n=1 Tax=Aristolochia fimbriata TaxID=158543 RepID=A0AAV7EZG1_ARIFI|nr:hypothetical protein H6P81_006424 [Aristolochia fimbriata]